MDRVSVSLSASFGPWVSGLFLFFLVFPPREGVRVDVVCSFFVYVVSFFPLLFSLFFFLLAYSIVPRRLTSPPP